MMRFAFVLLPMLLVMSSIVSAQTSTPMPAPWPPDSNAIFAEGVEWFPVNYGIPDDPVQDDYKREMIRVLDAETGMWREYPYPIPDRSFNAALRPDGLVDVRIFNERGGDPLPGELFVLDPATGIYTQPATVCEDKVIQAEAGEEKWVAAYRDEEKTDAFLCYSETGEMRDALPSNLREWKVYLNPSGTHLVAMGADLSNGDRFEVYAYDLVHDTLILLGESNYALEIYRSVCGWVSDTQGLVCSSGMQSWMGVRHEGFDVTQENSLAATGYSWHEGDIHLEDPVRYISISSDEYDSSKVGIQAGRTPCTVTIYDTTGQRETKIGDGCVPILIDPSNIAPAYRQGNSLYFLTKTDLEATVSTITRYDMAEETITEIVAHAGEVENIISVSPGERYIVALMDDNGALDFPWRAYRSRCCPAQYGWFVAIIDAKTDNIIYISEPMGVYSSSDVKWLDDETVVIASDEIYRHLRNAEISLPATLRQIQLGEIITTQSMTMAVDVASPNQYGLHNQNTVIDLFTFEPVSIFQDDILETYSVRTRWDEENGDLVVYVSLPDASSSKEYRVVLP